MEMILYLEIKFHLNANCLLLNHRENHIRDFMCMTLLHEETDDRFNQLNVHAIT